MDCSDNEIPVHNKVANADKIQYNEDIDAIIVVALAEYGALTEPGIVDCEQSVAIDLISDNGFNFNMCSADRIGKIVGGTFMMPKCIEVIKDMQYYLFEDFNKSTGILDQDTLDKMEEALESLKYAISNGEEFGLFEDLDAFCPRGSAFCNNTVDIIDIDGTKKTTENRDDIMRENSTKGSLEYIQNTIIKKIIDIIAGLATTITITMIIVAAIRMAANSSDMGKFREAAMNLKHAVIGLFVIMFAYFLVTSIIKLVYQFFG